MARKKETVKEVSNFNLQKVTTNELSEHISTCIQTGKNLAVFGRRGTGKTEIAKDVIKTMPAENGKRYEEVYINLSVLERVDMGGYPDMLSPARGENFVKFMLPSMYEKMIVPSDVKIVALLDEVDKADPSLWAPLLEFTQFRSINGRALPNLQAVLMTGNLIAEGGQRPSLPLLDRAEKYLVEADAKQWLDWNGKTQRAHPSVAAYIFDNPLHLYGPIDADDRYADSSPRSWINFSDILFKGEQLGWSNELLIQKAAGYLGKEVATQYEFYFKYYRSLLPLVEKIFSPKGNLKEIKREHDALKTESEKFVLSMTVCTRLATKMDQSAKDLEQAMESVINFFLNVSNTERWIPAARTQLTQARILDYLNHPVFGPYLEKIRMQVLGFKKEHSGK